LTDHGAPVQELFAMAPIEPASPHVMNTYGRLPIALSRGQGVRVWDVNGKEYLDALAGIAVNTLGHNHPKLVPALHDQVSKLIHSCNYYHVPGQEQLATKLTQLSGMTNAFFCCTGLEANEAAIKLARKFGHDKGIERPQIVVYEKAFHGRSIATLSATGNEKVQKGFGPLVEGFIRVPMNDIDALKKATRGNRNVVAVFFETIQGEGGINPMRIDYLQQVRALCDQNDWLLMIDEVQCGMGRTGKWFAHQWAGIVPDVMPLAKGLGSGVPIGAVVAGPRAANIFQPGQPRHHLRRQPAGDARRHRNHPHHGGGRPAGERRVHRRVHPRAAGARARRPAGRQGHPRPGPDDRHGTRPALLGAGGPRRRGRAAAERDRRHRGSPAAAADLHPRPMRRSASASWRRW
jgi:acetylornithine/succinyldiaminopimelate/putrescine aminotransferase